MVAGFELCNAYSEQNDPDRQLAAFEAEARAKAQGDPEAGDIDYDYVRALEYGHAAAPAGSGIGIDRLVMLLSGADNIREVILFPTMRPEAGSPADGLRTARHARCGSSPPRARPEHAPARAEPRLTREHHHRRSDQERDPPVSADEPRWPVRLIAGLTALAGLLAADWCCRPVAAPSRLHAGGQARSARPGSRVTGSVLTVLRRARPAVPRRARSRAETQAGRVADQRWSCSRSAGPSPAWLKGGGLAIGRPLPGDGARAGAGNRRPVPSRDPDPPSLLRLARLVPMYWLRCFGTASTSLVLRRGSSACTPEFSRAGAAERPCSAGWSASAARTLPWALFDECCSRQPAAARRGRRRGARLPAVPPAAGAARTRSDRLAARAAAWSTPTARTRWPTSRCATDKSFFFASDGEAMIAYTYLGGYALVGATRSGRRARSTSLLTSSSRSATSGRGAPAFLAARDVELPRYDRPGLRALLPGRRGDHALRPVRPGRCVDEERARRRASGRAARTGSRCIASRNASAPAGDAAQRDQRAAGGARPPSAASPCRSARTSRARARTRSSCSASPSTRTAAPAASCGSCPPTGQTSATRWT